MEGSVLKRIKLVLGFMTLLFCGQSTAQERTGAIDLTVNSFKEFEVFGDSLDRYSVYFTGENHTYTTFNTQFEFKFLRYLHQTQNVKHFIFEQSPGLSYIINKVILEDETTHMLYLGDMFFDPFYDLVKELRKYNDTLLPANKIKVHGIDIERFPSFSLYALDYMVEKLDKSVDGGEVFEQIQALASSEVKKKGPDAFYGSSDDNVMFQFGEVSAWQSLSSIIDGANANKPSLKLALGEDSTQFFSIIESLEVGHEWYVTEQEGDVKSPIIRERFMAEEFERVYRADMNSKYYGQFGRCHLHKDQHAERCYDYYMNSIANRINDVHPSLDNQVLVVPIFYNKAREFDKDVIKSLRFDERFTLSQESFIIDLAYKNGDHPIVGFYDNLPFMILCNAEKDPIDFTAYDWDNTVEEVHLGAGIGYTFFNKLNKLNAVLLNNGLGTFSKQITTYSFYADYFLLKDQGISYYYNYFPEVSNGDRFSLRGYNISIGSSYPVGGRYFLTAFGVNVGYGQMKLVEEQTVGAPNLIQIDTKNKTVYRNDMVLIDPNIQIRLTLPVISLNIKAGYALDVSGKYWRLDQKAKNFTKTSFSAPYVMVGASFNVKL